MPIGGNGYPGKITNDGKVIRKGINTWEETIDWQRRGVKV